MSTETPPTIRSVAKTLKVIDYDGREFPQELLREGMSTQEVWMLKTIWQMDAKVAWLCRSLVEENESLRAIDVREQELAHRLDERLKNLEEWKINLMGKWGAVSIAVVTCVTAVLSATISLITEKLFK
jgi:hypothetical protein